MRVLAIDPGFDRLGIAVLQGTGSNPILLWSDCIQPPKGEREKRLGTIAKNITHAVDTYAPDVAAIETLFFSTNKKTALAVAEARGAILSTLGQAGVPVREYSPGTIKVAVTGNGRADKSAIARMIPQLISLPSRKRLDDELDAIALGITALGDRF